MLGKLLQLFCVFSFGGVSGGVSGGRNIAVIGGGVSGLTAACELSKKGYNVTLFEKNDDVGGRARVLKSGGFSFDMGPSWYWMPEIYEQVFDRFGYDIPYNLTRLDPAYRVFQKNDNDGYTHFDVPGNADDFKNWLGGGMEIFFNDSRAKHDRVVKDWIWRPMNSFWDLINPSLIWDGMYYKLFGSLNHWVNGTTRDTRIQMALKWPVIFIGVSPNDSPSLWSFLSYASANTFYPDGGMNSPINTLKKIADDLGVHFRLNSEVTSLNIHSNRISKVCDNRGFCLNVEGVVGSGDYHHIEQKLLPYKYRNYDAKWWDKQILSPSCLVFYLGFNMKLNSLLHHNFFFDKDLDHYINNIFGEGLDGTGGGDIPFYVSATSKTDLNVAPEGGETLFILIPFHFSVDDSMDTDKFRRRILNIVLKKLVIMGAFGEHCGKKTCNWLNYDFINCYFNSCDFGNSLVYYSSFGPSDFKKNYNAFKGNAFGHANILSQSLFLKPSMRSKISNLVFTGHLTHPGPGVPPSMVSGILAANLLQKNINIFNINFILLLNIFLLFILWNWLYHRFIIVRSYFECCRLFYIHGRTYFAASTLMNVRRFLDTAAMYSLFRVVDDYVDTNDCSYIRKRKLDNFEHYFWMFYDNNDGGDDSGNDDCDRDDYDIKSCYAFHPILPAVMLTINRLNYSPLLFETFFKSMHMDVDTHICKTFEDTYTYMQGSAAIIGDFMLPILISDVGDGEMGDGDMDILEKRRVAEEHARDLGRAFQLTNMIRDIDEDIDLRRQYVPEDLCARHNVNIDKRDYSQLGWSSVIEEMFDYTEQFYVSGDVGIEMLGKDVRNVIKVARKMYYKIHDKIREHNYDLFSGKRIRVSFSEKILIASQHITFFELSRIVLIEFIAFLYWNFPLLIVIFLGNLISMSCNYLLINDCWVWNNWLDYCGDGVSYMQFHFAFTFPLLAWLYRKYIKRFHNHYKNFTMGSFLNKSFQQFLLLCFIVYLQCFIATIYTIPWDNYLIYSNSWSYPSERILFTIGYVPIEEYMFFGLDAAIVCGIFLIAFKGIDIKRKYCDKKDCLNIGAAIMTLGATGLFVPNCHYLSAIILWATPVICLQTWWDFNTIAFYKIPLLKCILTSTIYLTIADKWALERGIWKIDKSLFDIYPGMPFEECFFFFVTSIMCSFGFLLTLTTFGIKITDIE